MIKCGSGNCFYWHHVCFLFKHGVACHITPDPSKRPRRRWSRRIGSLEVMVKSMLDLRQLETFSHKKNGSSHDKERQSAPTEVRMELRLGGEGAVCMRCRDAHHLLQLGNRAKRHQPWLSLHSCKGTRNPDGAVWYSEEDKDGACLRGRYRTSLLSAPGFTFTATLAGKKTALDVCLCPFSSWVSPLTHCCQTSAVRWRRGRTAGCSGGTRAVTARRAAARTALVMWAMTAGAPAPTVTWMVSSALHIQKSQYNIYLFLNFYLNIYRTTVITLFPRKIFKNRYKL